MLPTPVNQGTTSHTAAAAAVYITPKNEAFTRLLFLFFILHNVDACACVVLRTGPDVGGGARVLKRRTE